MKQAGRYNFMSYSDHLYSAIAISQEVNLGDTVRHGTMSIYLEAMYRLPTVIIDICYLVYERHRTKPNQ